MNELHPDLPSLAELEQDERAARARDEARRDKRIRDFEAARRLDPTLQWPDPMENWNPEWPPPPF